MTDEPAPKVFDMPHARVTLTPVGPNVEIEVWPKAGQSAYAVIDPRVAILIARQLVEMAALQLAAAAEAAVEETAAGEATTDEAAAGDDGPGEDGAGVAEEADGPGTDAPSNIVDLAGRRRKNGNPR